MAELSFTDLLLVAAAAFAAPLILDLTPLPTVPAIVAEILAGILIGPSVLGIAEVDEPVRVLSQIGLVFLFFLAGLEIAFDRVRGRALGLAFAGFAISFVMALGVGHGLEATKLVEAPLFVGIVLAATAFGIVVAVLKDAREASTDLGQLIIVGASVADFGTVILLSLFFSARGSGVESTLVLLGLFVVTVVVVALALSRARLSPRLADAVGRLERTTAEIGVRGAFVLLIAFVALAEEFGLEVVLGAFLSGAILSFVGKDDLLKTSRLGSRLEAVGFGVFIPIFFVTSGVQFDLDALLDSASTVLLVPIVLVALLLVRGLPALLYRPLVDDRSTVAAVGLLQATSLPFLVAASQIAVELGKISSATAAGLIAAGLLSVIVFPAAALRLIAGRKPSDTPSAAVVEEGL